MAKNTARTPGAWGIRWPRASQDTVPRDWFDQPGHFQSWHLVGEGEGAVRAECQVLVRTTSATLTYKGTASNKRHGIEEGHTVLTFAHATRREVSGVQWWPRGQTKEIAGQSYTAAWPHAELPVQRRAPGQTAFVANPGELIDSVLSFAEADEAEQSEALGNHPKYFVHLDTADGPAFGLSKCVVFHDASVEDYLAGLYDTTSGGTAQRHIAAMTGLTWTPMGRLPPSLRRRFLAWFRARRTTPPREENLFVLSLGRAGQQTSIRPAGGARPRRPMSPEDLQRRMSAQEALGQRGEAIAVAYEIARLTELGVTDAKSRVTQTSKSEVNAGYDLVSDDPKGRRYIEVKASRSANGRFFLSENEAAQLEHLQDEGYLYLVQVIQDSPPRGKVLVWPNPMPALRAAGILTPVAYEVALKDAPVSVLKHLKSD